uniref:Pre-mRNA-splicing factor Syf1-like N-terminal HAT-repeats domain-containing protein n=1 Tax=Cyanoderma ruficeps TaxID=181631 RepID=A0A8C3QGH5_9PASS
MPLPQPRFHVPVPSCVREEEEVQHEEELLRNPFSVRGWLRYAQARQRGPRPRLNQIYERALRELPGRYAGGTGLHL